MLRASGRVIQRAATTIGSLPLSKSLLRTLLKSVCVARIKVASFHAGTRNQSGHLTEFCRKCCLCFRSTAVSWSGNPAFSIKEIPRDSCSSTRLGTHRYSGDDSQSGCGTQTQHLLRQNPLPRSQFGSRRGCPAQHELPAARDGAGNPIEVVGAWSDEGDEWGVGRGGAGGAVGACRISRAADSGAICLAAVTMGGKQAHPTLTPGT